MTTGAVQAQSYYGTDKKYNSYEPLYGMDSYDKPIPIYDDKKLYDDKPIYPLYVKDDKRDKSSKDSKKSVSLNKIKCINTNLNINGNNTGNINLGNKGTAEEGYLGAYSSDGGGYDGGEGYYDYGYDNKRDKGFECIINNNNNNTNVVVGGGGNVTDGNGNVTDACEECFNANTTLATIITNLLANPVRGPISVAVPSGSIVIGINVDTLAQLCDFLEAQISAGTLPQTATSLTAVINAIVISGPFAGVSTASIFNLVLCLLGVDFTGGTDNITRSLIPFDINTNAAGDLTASNINTNAAGDLTASNINTDTSSASNINAAGSQAASFSPPTIAQGAEEDSSALEKIEKLKKQWLDLLP